MLLYVHSNDFKDFRNVVKKVIRTVENCTLINKYCKNDMKKHGMVYGLQFVLILANLLKYFFESTDCPHDAPCNEYTFNYKVSRQFFLTTCGKFQAT